jgi:hypothetical protein
VYGEGPIEPGESEQFEQFDARAHQRDIAAVHPRPSQRAHQHTQAGVVDGAEAVEVEHHQLAGMLGDHAHEPVPQPRHGSQIELTRHGDHYSAIDIVHVNDEINDRVTLQSTP